MTVKPIQPKSELLKEGKPKPMSQGNVTPKKSFHIGEYFKGVKQEWFKITWPSRSDVVRDTAVVLLVVTFFALFVFVFDKLFQWIIQVITA